MRVVVTREQMQELDRETIDTLGIPGFTLMESAGRAVVDALLEEWPTAARIAVVCGGGNNGGDGFVIARVLRDRGYDATVHLACPKDKVRGDAKEHLAVYERSSGPVHSIATADTLLAQTADIQAAHVVVDALVGTGLTREIGGHLEQVIRVMNGRSGGLLAVDVPSGLCANAGRVLGVAVHPDVTVTMAFEKVGLASSPGFARAGRVRVAEIGIPLALAMKRRIGLHRYSFALDRHVWPVPGPLDHKATRGHVLCLAGSPGKRGAARLLAKACFRTGAGLVTVAAEGASTDHAMPDHVMTEELSGADVSQLVPKRSAVVLGPGMALGPVGAQMVRSALSLPVPVCLDADALNHVGQELALLATRSAGTVLTPHPGEAARLLACTVQGVQDDRVQAVRAIAKAAGAVVILKGARPLVADEHGEFVSIHSAGGPELATAGTGDVLAGAVAGFLAQGVPPLQAARFAVEVHGMAGHIAARDRHVASVTASDVCEALGVAMQKMSVTE